MYYVKARLKPKQNLVEEIFLERLMSVEEKYDIIDILMHVF